VVELAPAALGRGRHLRFLNFKRFPTKDFGNDKAERPLIDWNNRKDLSDLIALRSHFIGHCLKGDVQVFTNEALFRPQRLRLHLFSIQEQLKENFQ